eukprot:8890174-Karenia_brevis.AAC.1
MNLDITNSMLRTILGDIRTLPYPGQWQSIELDDDHALVHSTSDMEAAYYAFAMEPCWFKYFAFDGEIHGSDLTDVADVDPSRTYFACSR